MQRKKFLVLPPSSKSYGGQVVASSPWLVEGLCGLRASR